jgi:hypothetical protein
MDPLEQQLLATAEQVVINALLDVMKNALSTAFQKGVTHGVMLNAITSGDVVADAIKAENATRMTVVEAKIEKENL